MSYCSGNPWIFSFISIPFGVLLAASSLSVQSSAPSLLDDLLDILRSLTSLKRYETVRRGTVTSSPYLFSRLTEGIGTPCLTTEGNRTDELVPGLPKKRNVSLSSSFIFLRKGLQLVRGTIIFYIDVHRESRTCRIPAPSVFFNRNRNSFSIF